MRIRHPNRRPKHRKGVTCSYCASNKFGKDRRSRKMSKLIHRNLELYERLADT